MIKSLLKGSAALALVIGGSAAFAEDAAPVAAPGAPAAAEVAPAVDYWKNVPEVVAEVDGVKITKGEVQKALAQMIPGGQIPAGLPQDQVDMAIAELTHAQAMSILVKNALAKSGFNPSDAEIKAFVKNYFSTKFPPQVLQMMLEREKTTLDAIADEVVKSSEDKKSAIEAMFIEKEAKAAPVTEADAKKYYDENAAKFVKPGDPADSYRASHILVGVKAQATDEEKAAAEKKINEILAKVKADPAKFEEIAKTSSECPSSAQGGALGNFRKGMMVPEFEEALDKLKEGEISGVVKTQFGYHIVRRDPLEKESKIEFDQIKDRLIIMLEQQAKLEAEKNYVESLEKAAKIEYFYPAKAAK